MRKARSLASWAFTKDKTLSNTPGELSWGSTLSHLAPVHEAASQDDLKSKTLLAWLFRFFKFSQGPRPAQLSIWVKRTSSQLLCPRSHETAGTYFVNRSSKTSLNTSEVGEVIFQGASC